MKNKVNNNIAIVFDDLTEFFTIEPAISKLEKNGYKIDLIVPYDSGYNGLAEHTIKKVKELGYSPKNDAPKNKTYKILLTPYPGLDVVKRMNFVYHLRYPYGALSPKPNPTYLPDHVYYYDGIFLFNKHETYLNAYGPIIYPLPYWRYHNFKNNKRNTKSKPTLLLLPTFGADISFINRLTTKAIKDIKKHYHVIAKAHHAVHFDIDGQGNLDKLKNACDEFYDSDTAIDVLLSKADIVLSDNSGAIFDSICANVPVAIFTDSPNSRRLGKLDTLQYQLVQKGIIPQAKKADEVLPILLNIKHYTEKQRKLKKDLFVCDYQDPFEEFLKIIRYYITKDENKDERKMLHDYFLSDLLKKDQAVQRLEQEAKECKRSIDAIHNSTSWKITKPLRKIKATIKKEPNV